MPSQYRSIYQQTKNPKMHPIIPPPPPGYKPHPCMSWNEFNLLWHFEALVKTSKHKMQFDHHY